MSSENRMVPIGKHQYVGEFMEEYQEKSVELRGRKFKFLQEKQNENSARELARGALYGLAAGTGTGMIVGGVVGGICGSPGGPPGVILGISIGVPLGAAIGTALGVGIAANNIEPKFLKWCGEKEALEFMSKLAPFLANEESLKEFICPITQMALIDAVRTPNGTLYEKYAIEAWIEKNGTDPLTRKKLTIQELVSERSISFESNKNFLEAVRKNIHRIQMEAPSLIPQIDATIQDIRESAIDQYNGKLLILQNQYKERKISYETFQLLTQKLMDKYFNI